MSCELTTISRGRLARLIRADLDPSWHSISEWAVGSPADLAGCSPWPALLACCPGLPDGAVKIRYRCFGPPNAQHQRRRAAPSAAC
jgi:hypothetical protein